MGEASSPARAASISTSEINFQQRNDPEFFGQIVGLLWPQDKYKQDYELHLRTGATDRMCRNWISGSHPPNARAIRTVLGEILRRLE